MEESHRVLAAMMSFNTCFILAGITIVLLEMGELDWAIIFAAMMAIYGSGAYALGYDGLNRRLWEWVGGRV